MLASLLIAAAPFAFASAQTPPRPSSSTAPGDTFGIDLASPQHPSGTAASPSTVALGGIGWVRIVADWAVLAPTRGAYLWTPLDAAIRQAAAAKTHVVLLLQGTPRWAAMTPDAPASVWSRQPPQRVADWAAFVTSITQRYGSRVAAWQVEPSLDLADFRGTTQDYVAMLHVVRTAVTRADPGALVVAASPGGFDLPYVQMMLTRNGGDFDAIMLYPRGRRPAEALQALSTIHTRILTDAHHQLWMYGRQEWGAPVQLAALGVAEGVTREFWPALDPPVLTAMRYLAGARYVGPLDRGPGIVALMFEKGGAPAVVAWTAGEPQAVAIPTIGPAAVVTASGQPALVAPGEAGKITVGPDPVWVTNPDRALVDEAARAAAQGPLTMAVDPAHDFSRADAVSAQLGATDDEHGLYNQRLRALPSGAVVPVTVDGSPAVRTDASTEAVYVYFVVDGTFAYFDNGRYDFVVTVEAHRASAAQLVGFNLMYDSMTGYRFTPWQWVDAGSGWATYTFRVTDADFSKTWGWDFAINGAGDRKENLVVRSVSVQRVAAGAPAH
jgi:hypothetical protein